jgi:uncharacterized membrane protein YeaQ/YmgE (transglycosylase-associated protein family)
MTATNTGSLQLLEREREAIRAATYFGLKSKTVRPYGSSMGIISWIFLGLIAGALAKFIVPGKDPGGFLITILIGIVGGVLGGFLGSFMGLGKVESFDLGGVIIATLGAIILLILYRLFRKGT